MGATANVITAYTNESKVRLTALFVLAGVVLYLFSGKIILPVFLVIDFALRSFNLPQYSPLALFSGWLVKTLKLPVKPVFYPPKRFAARIGLLFSIAIVVLHLLSINTIIVGAVLAFFAALESFVGFCAGCYVYDFLQRFKRTA
jgi:hypothetical protein